MSRLCEFDSSCTGEARQCAAGPVTRHLALVALLLLALSCTASVSSAAGTTPPSVAVSGGFPWINLAAPQELEVETGQATGPKLQACSLAEVDLDQNGIPDLLIGYATDAGGLLVLRSGDERAYPTRGAELPFLEASQATQVPIRPELVASGDLDGDGSYDVVVAVRDGRELALLRGDGAGHLAAAELVGLPGRLTALAAGEVNRRDHILDLAVAVTRADGSSSLLVYEGPNGALRATPEVFPLPAPATDIVLGSLDRQVARDIAVAAGSELVIIRGRDRRLSWDASVRDAVAPATVDRLELEAPIQALAVGRFFDRFTRQLAVLLGDGQLMMVEADEGAGWQRRPAAGWQQRLVGAGSRLLTARVSSLPADDLLLCDANETLLLNLAGSGDTAGSGVPVAANLAIGQQLQAILPMRLNLDALHDLVVLAGDVGSVQVLLTAPVATYTVDQTTDTTDYECIPHSCTLRDAIYSANVYPGLDTIRFQDGIAKIQLTDQLPDISEAVLIDGAQYSGTVRTEIDVSQASLVCGNNCEGLVIEAADVTIASIELHHFTSYGILFSLGPGAVQSSTIGIYNGAVSTAGVTGIKVSADDVTIGGSNAQRNIISGNLGSGIAIDACSGTTVTGNYIGTSENGMAAVGNVLRGISILNEATDIDIGSPTAPNIISGNGSSGVWIGFGATPPSSVLVVSNIIGLGSNGATPLANLNGVTIQNGTGNTIGGTTMALRNIISGNTENGVYLQASTTTGTAVQGNRIGLQVNGDTMSGNGQVGIYLSRADGNTIGGAVAGSTNLVGGNGSSGIVLSSTSSDSPDNNFIQRNIIGLNASSTQARGNSAHGMVITGVGNTIGGAGVGNVVAGNARNGIVISGYQSTTSGIVVQGNRIGLDGSASPFPNGEAGITASGLVTGVTIGGTPSDERNLIRNNLGPGIEVTEGSNDVAATGVEILGNSIADNGGLGIDLWATASEQGVTPNDDGDADDGPNGMQNYPVITTFNPDTDFLSMVLYSTPSTQHTIWIFASPTCDASGHGEAYLAVATTTLWVLGPGYGSVSVQIPGIPESWFFTALAIDPNGNSSELSECFSAAGQPSEIFSDGFESGNVSAWSSAVP